MEQDEDQDEPMEEESMEEADKEHPEAAEIRELRNRLETFDLVSDTLLICLVLWKVISCFKENSSIPNLIRKALGAKDRCLVMKELTWVFDPAPCYIQYLLAFYLLIEILKWPHKSVVWQLFGV